MWRKLWRKHPRKGLSKLRGGGVAVVTRDAEAAQLQLMLDYKDMAEPFLVEALQASDEGRRDMIGTFTGGVIVPKSWVTIKILLEALRHKDSGVRQAAATALRRALGLEDRTSSLERPDSTDMAMLVTADDVVNRMYVIKILLWNLSIKLSAYPLRIIDEDGGVGEELLSDDLLPHVRSVVGELLSESMGFKLRVEESNDPGRRKLALVIDANTLGLENPEDAFKLQALQRQMQAALERMKKSIKETAINLFTRELYPNNVSPGDSETFILKPLLTEQSVRILRVVSVQENKEIVVGVLVDISNPKGVVIAYGQNRIPTVTKRRGDEFLIANRVALSFGKSNEITVNNQSRFSIEIRDLAMMSSPTDNLEDMQALIDELLSGEIPVKVGIGLPENANVARTEDVRRIEAGEKDRVGGINLDPALLDLQIRRDGNGVVLPLHQQPADLKIDGVFPVIIDVKPINLPLLLGLVEEGPENRAKKENVADPAPVSRLPRAPGEPGERWDMAISEKRRS